VDAVALPVSTSHLRRQLHHVMPCYESDAMRVTLLLVRLESEQEQEWTETASHMQERTGSSAIHHLPGIQCLAVPGAFYSLVILKACFPFISFQMACCKVREGKTVL
jgi:hypothetical protein